MTDLDAAVHAWLRLAAERLVAAAPTLTELDARIGDGDHGINLGRGMRAVMAGLDDAGTRMGAAEALGRAGRILVSSVGGASGPLYGTFFLEAAAALGPAGLGGALVAGADGVGRRGHSAVGQKTMLDALVPATAALARELGAGGSLAAAARTAAIAARAGSERTRPLVAQRGRASYLGERAIGHLDPGAESSRILIEALADAAAQLEAEGSGVSR